MVLFSPNILLIISVTILCLLLAFLGFGNWLDLKSKVKFLFNNPYFVFIAYPTAACAVFVCLIGILLSASQIKNNNEPIQFQAAASSLKTLEDAIEDPTTSANEKAKAIELKQEFLLAIRQHASKQEVDKLMRKIREPLVENEHTKKLEVAVNQSLEKIQKAKLDVE